MKVDDIDRFIESCRIQPGQLEHLYPPLKGTDEDADVDTDGDIE